VFLFYPGEKSVPPANVFFMSKPDSVFIDRPVSGVAQKGGKNFSVF